MQVVTYARVSTSGQVEHGFSLGEQRERLAQYCAAKGYHLREHIADEGISGRLADRPGLRRLLDLAGSGEIGAVIAINLTRLGRENRLIQDVLHQVRERGVRAEFCEHASGDRPTDRLLTNVLGGIAEFEWASLREKTMNGRDQKARERGVTPVGRAPYGYRCISRAEAQALPEYAGRDGELVPIPEEAEIVREIFERYADGGSIRALAVWLDTEQHRTGRTFSVAGLQKTLANPAYKGEPVYGRSRNEIEKGQKRRTYDHGGERIPLKPCPALVPAELWERCQVLRRENVAKLGGRPSDFWPLKGIVSCGCCPTVDRIPSIPRSCCGAGGTGRRRKYQCTSRWQRGGTYCGTQYDAEKLEALVREALTQAAQPGVLAAAERQRAQEAAQEAGDPIAAAKRLKADLAALDAEEERIADLALQGFSPALVAKKLDAVKAKRAAAETGLAEAREKVKRRVDPEKAAANGEALARRLREVLDDPERLLDLAREVCRVTLYRDAQPDIRVKVAAI